MTGLPQLRTTLLSGRDLLLTAGPFAVLVVVLLGVAYWALDPTPPRQVTLATGPDQGAYAEFGQRYKAQLARFGIDVKLRSTAGSGENLALLQDPSSGVDFAFVQGGADRQRQASEAPIDGLVSLGSLFYEPIWLFYRDASAQRLLGNDKLETLAQLKGWRVNVGAEGSGVTNLMLRLLDANGIDASEIQAQRLAQTPAVMDLLAGDTDAVVFASAPEAPLVQMLLLTPGIRLLDFTQAEAYSRRLPMLVPVLLPRGVVQLADDIPGSDVHLVAPTAMLVARDTAHPALQQLFVQAASSIHGGAGWFQKRGDFPNALSGDLPLSKEAERFLKTGPPWLQRWLPFWLANLIDRMWVVMASIVVVLIPLSRVLPPLYELRIRSRVFRWYGKLRQIEEALAQRTHAPQPLQPLLAELDALDQRVRGLHVPLSHADELYALRGHIDMVRGTLTQLLSTPTAADAPFGRGSPNALTGTSTPTAPSTP